MQLRKSRFPAGILLFVVLAVANNMARAEPAIQFAMGKLGITDKNTSISLEPKNSKAIKIESIAGKYWPWISTDELGMLYAGDKTINTHTGKIVASKANPDLLILGPNYGVVPDISEKTVKIMHKDNQCAISLNDLHLADSGKNAKELLRDKNLVFVDSSGVLVALVTLLKNQISETSYEAFAINPDSCKVVSSENLGNPDLLIELGWTAKGRWWITGSIEQTLLRSDDGKKWSPVKLPEEISSLVSSYISDKDTIWLAANYAPTALDAGPMIVASKDNGKNWQSVIWDSPLMREVPKFWLEGQIRLHSRQASAP